MDENAGLSKRNDAHRKIYSAFCAYYRRFMASIIQTAWVHHRHGVYVIGIINGEWQLARFWQENNRMMHIRIHSIRKVKISWILPTTKATATDQEWRWKRTTTFTRTSSRSSRSWPNCKYLCAKTRRTYETISIFCKNFVEKWSKGRTLGAFMWFHRSIVHFVSWIPLLKLHMHASPSNYPSFISFQCGLE